MAIETMRIYRELMEIWPNEVCDIKVGSPVILLRNLDPGEGLCNGTRMVVLNVRREVLQCRIISKNRRFRGKVVLIPRIRLSPNAETLPVPLKRLQFPGWPLL